MAEAEWREAEVAALRDLTSDIRMFDLVATGGLTRPASGAHVTISVPIEGRTETRSYSIVEATSEGGWRIAVKRSLTSRGGSDYMWSLAPGARVTVSGPNNAFPLASGCAEYLLVAGGIGVTPVYAHARALARAGANFRLAYAVRRREDLALAAELRAAIGDRLETFVSAEGQRIDLAAEFARLAQDGEAYVCGPVRMLEAAKRAWREAGRAAEQLRFETFGAGGGLPTTAFRARLPRLGKEIDVPETRTLLEALEDAGVEMISDCRKGECGLCALTILAVDGVVDHRDVFLSEEEKAASAKLCTCVSRVYGGSITLDTADR
jgi:vanillate O-demethylase ferredoxin subunit